MSKPAWTPGPWSVITAKGYPYAIQASHVSPHEPGAIRDITRWGAISMPSSAEGQANARLIAEAPAMAEALGALEAALDEAHSALNGAPYTVGVDCQITHALSEARAILARINGEAGR